MHIHHILRGENLLVLITYDVSTKTAAGVKRLSKVAKVCINYGQRVQNSVFECVVDRTQFAMLKKQISDIIDEIFSNSVFRSLKYSLVFFIEILLYLKSFKSFLFIYVSPFLRLFFS